MKNSVPSPVRKSRGAPERHTERNRIAKEAGLSRRQMYQALATVSIPHDVFERLVESDDPPGVSCLAKLGVRYSRNEQQRAAARQRRPPERCPYCGQTIPKEKKRTARSAKESGA